MSNKKVLDFSMDSWTGWSFTFRLIISFLIWKRIINFKKFSIAFYKTKYHESTDILRVSLNRATCDMPEYHNIFMASKTFDTLDIQMLYKINSFLK